MDQISQSLLIKALRRQPVERTPVWIMRQAGRYLPEYRAVRQKAGDFMRLCKTPELACEVTLQPLRRFQLDAAILFSDILTIPDAMGLGLYFVEGEGPCFQKPLSTIEAIQQLPVPDPQTDLSYVMDAVRLIRREMPADLPLIGFSGSPWTLACYMVEGRSSREFKQILKLLYQDPLHAHMLMEKLVKAVTAYLQAQVAAGANALMIFDTWGGVLPPELYQKFSLAPMQQIVAGLKAVYPDIPITLFTKGGGQWLEWLAATGCDALGLDWTTDLSLARKRVGDKVALQGNLHPAILLTSPEVIRAEVKKVLEAYGPGAGHIFNLGHGITPDVPPDNLAVLIEAVREYSHQK